MPGSGWQLDALGVVSLREHKALGNCAGQVKYDQVGFTLQTQDQFPLMGLPMGVRPHIGAAKEADTDTLYRLIIGLVQVMMSPSSGIHFCLFDQLIIE